MSYKISIAIMIAAFMLFVIIQLQYQVNTLSNINDTLSRSIDMITKSLPGEVQNDILNGLRPPIQ